MILLDWYAYPNSTDSTGIFEFMRYVNVTADGLFFPVILLVIWFIAFIGVFSSGGQGRASASRGFAFASFLISVLSIMLSIMGFLAPKFMYLTFILTGVGALWLKAES